MGFDPTHPFNPSPITSKPSHPEHILKTFSAIHLLQRTEQTPPAQPHPPHPVRYRSGTGRTGPGARHLVSRGENCTEPKGSSGENCTGLMDGGIDGFIHTEDEDASRHPQAWQKGEIAWTQASSRKHSNKQEKWLLEI